jgi:hypothetical protein
MEGPDEVNEVADRVADLAAKLIARDGFPPFGIVLHANGVVDISNFFVDTGDSVQMHESIRHVAAKAAVGEWFAFGFDGTVDERDAVVFLLGRGGESQVAKFAMPYSFDGGSPSTTRPPRRMT